MINISSSETQLSDALDFLKTCKNQEIKNLYRASWFSEEEYVTQFGYADDRIFCFTSGAVVIELSNNVIFGIGSQESWASLTIWVERDEQMNWSGDKIIRDPEIHVLSAENTQYAKPRFREMLGKKIRSLKILKMKPYDSRYVGLPNDSGLILELENDLKLIVSYNLVRSPDNMCLVCEEDLPAESWEQIESIIEV